MAEQRMAYEWETEEFAIDRVRLRLVDQMRYQHLCYWTPEQILAQRSGLESVGIDSEPVPRVMQEWSEHHPSPLPPDSIPLA